MKSWRLNPWAAVREARQHAEILHGKVSVLRDERARLNQIISDYRESQDRLRSTVSNQGVRILKLSDELASALAERNVAQAALNVRKARRSAAISKGNRTKALRRRGALLPIHEPNLAERSAA